MRSTETGFQAADQHHSVPRIAAVLFTAWVVVWGAIMLWSYGPQNFIWLCNLAHFLLLYAVWRDHTLIASSQAGVVTLVGIGWSVDFLLGLLSGGELAYFTGYMFDPDLPLVARVVSTYHMILPFFCLWVVHRIGYDHRGPWLQTLIGGAAVLASWQLTDPERNLNLVHEPPLIDGLGVPEPIVILFLLILYPVFLYWPGHWIVRGILAHIRRSTEAQGERLR